MKDRNLIEMIGEAVESASAGCTITVPVEDGLFTDMPCPTLNYVFGNSEYVKARLDELSLTEEGNCNKLPMVALFCPFNEVRNDPAIFSKTKVNILIACSTRREWSNEQRLEYSFKNVLRPIYNSLMDALMKDRRFDFGYKPIIKHEYSENYSYGAYGAYTGSGEAVSEPIDAINITNLELTIKKPTCRL